MYVDDIFLDRNSLATIEWMKQILNSTFKIKNLGKLKEGNPSLLKKVCLDILALGIVSQQVISLTIAKECQASFHIKCSSPQYRFL